MPTWIKNLHNYMEQSEHKETRDRWHGANIMIHSECEQETGYLEQS